MALFLLSAQCKIDRFKLLHDARIFPIPIMRLLQSNLSMKVYNLVAKVEGKIGVIKVTHSILCTLLAVSS
jgi:hypothetical protein